MAKFEAKDPALVSYREHVKTAIDDIAPETWVMKSAHHKFTDHTRKAFSKGLNVKACVDEWMNRYREKPKDEGESAPAPATTAAPEGGHAVVGDITNVQRTEKGVTADFKPRNSWGGEFGKSDNATIPVKADDEDGA